MKNLTKVNEEKLLDDIFDIIDNKGDNKKAPKQEYTPEGATWSVNTPLSDAILHFDNIYKKRTRISAELYLFSSTDVKEFRKRCKNAKDVTITEETINETTGLVWYKLSIPKQLVHLRRTELGLK